MAGTIDIITRAFAGVRLDDDTVSFDPRLPPHLGCARFNLVHRGQRLRVALHPDRIEVMPDPCASNPRVRFRVGGTAAAAPAGHTTTIGTTVAGDTPALDRSGAGQLAPPRRPQ